VDALFLFLFCLAIGIPIYVFFAAIFHLMTSAPTGMVRVGLMIAAACTVLWVITAGLSLGSLPSTVDAGAALLAPAAATILVGSIAFLLARFRVQGLRKDLAAALIAMVMTTLIFDRYLVPIF